MVIFTKVLIGILIRFFMDFESVFLCKYKINFMYIITQEDVFDLFLL